MDKQIISEALLYFLDEKTVCIDAEFPETGIDHAYTMKASEWNLLLKLWNEYSDEWKEAITLFAGYAYLHDSSSILLKALYEKDPEIVERSLFSFYECIIAELDEKNHERSLEGEPSSVQLTFVFSEKDRHKLIRELDLRENTFKMHPELKELKRILLNQP